MTICSIVCLRRGASFAYAALIIIYQACIFGVQLLTISAPAGVSIYNAALRRCRSASVSSVQAHSH